MNWRRWMGFAALCLLTGSAWLFDEAAAGMLSGLTRTAVHEAVLALIFWLASRQQRPLHKLQWKVAAAAAAMFALPQVLMAGAGGHVSDLSELLVFLLVPVSVVFAVSQRRAGFGVDDNPLRKMVPALAGLGGAYLIVPFDWPASTAGRVWLGALAASALLAGAAAVWMHDMLQGIGWMRAMAIVAAVSSGMGGLFCWIDWGGAQAWSWSGLGVEALRLVLIEGPIWLLTVWLLRAMEPVRFSGRALLVPLIAIVESYVMLRPAAAWTTWAGMALMAAGGWGLLHAE